MKIANDAGHGGENRGKVGNGVVEKDWTLQQVRMFDSLLSLLGVDSIPTRVGDFDLSKKERDALTFDADVVLSFHANAGAPEWRGVRLLYYPGNRKMRRLGDAVAKHWPPEMLSKKRSVTVSAAYADKWPDAHAVLSGFTKDTLLIEFGFLSNAKDAALLQNDVMRHRMNLAIAQGLLS